MKIQLLELVVEQKSLQKRNKSKLCEFFIFHKQSGLEYLGENDCNWSFVSEQESIKKSLLCDNCCLHFYYHLKEKSLLCVKYKLFFK